MNSVRLAIVSTTLAALGAVESMTPAPGDARIPSPESAELSDFIMPVASDMRMGYSANVGSHHRSQEGGSGTDGRFIEHGLWASYVRALSGPVRAMSGRTEWRAEVGILASQADVSNPNGSTGTLQTAMLDLGIGPAWTIVDNGTCRQEWEIMPFVGVGQSQYTNRYTSQSSGVSGPTTIDASGQCLEYGIKANLLWYWENGWGVALQAGFVQRVDRLNGDSNTHWNNGTVNHSDYASDDTLTGVRFGLFVAKRF